MKKLLEEKPLAQDIPVNNSGRVSRMIIEERDSQGSTSARSLNF